MNRISPLDYFFDPSTGRPVSLGKVYIGEPDTDPTVVGNQKQVYALQESGVSVAISQPISLSAGGAPVYNGSVVTLYVDGLHSLKVLSSLGAQVTYIPTNDISYEASVGTFDTVADMVAGSPPVGAIVQTKGYYSVGDGGSGSYLIVTSATFGGVPDGFADHSLASGDVAVLQVNGEWYIEQLGAVGDGVTDDSGSFQAAIDKSPGITKLAPEKTYLITSQIDIDPENIGVHFKGTDRGTIFAVGSTAVIKLGFDGVLFDISGDGISDTFLGITFEDIYFDGDGANRAAGTCFYCNSLARGVNITHCYVVGFRDYGLRSEPAGSIQIYETDIFNCGYNIYGNSLADSRIYGGESGSGAGGGAPWVVDNIYLLGSSGNTHFVNHRANFSAGVGVRIGGNASRISFIGGFCDQNLGGGFILEGTCTSIKIQGMDIFDNGTTAAKKPAIDIQTSQGTAGFQGGPAGIEIIGNNIFDRDAGTGNETQDIGIKFAVGGSVTYTSIIGNGLNSISTPIDPIATVRLKPQVLIEGNNGYRTRLSGITTATLATDSTGVKSINGISVAGLGTPLHSGSIIQLTFTSASHVTFAGTLSPVFTAGNTTFDIRANITTASGTGGSTAKVAWEVIN